ncbi:DUF2914 domain-containing protein [Acetobacteraceae bacterium]|nr:DUF2914 domain-containing protein [Candidatus Parcubacteria bacterium]
MRQLQEYIGPLMGLWRQYERYISAGGLIVGFCFDLIVADRPDSVFNNLLLLFYLLIAGSLIIILNLRSALRERQEGTAEPLFLLFVLQICFGALASNLLILYGRSGTLVGSALFIGLLAAMLIGNEFLKNRYAQLRFNIAVYYLLLFSYLLIAIPTFVFHSVGTGVFLASGIASLVFIAVFLGLLYYFIFRGRDRQQQLFEVSSIVFGIFLIFNGFYFLNIIPPVPLALKDIGIYHSIIKTAGGYTVAYNSPPIWKFWRSTDTTYVSSERNAYCFSAVFAPTDLRAPIFHRWEKKDPTSGEWTTTSRISFDISGGRAQGYRGYSLNSRLSAGRWRCSVETESGALIGRFSFTVVSASTTPMLSTKTL